MWWLSVAFGQEVLFQDEIASEIKEVAVNSDQTMIALLQSAEGQVHLMSESDWEVITIDPCSSGAGGIAFDSSDILYVGCNASGIVSIDTTNDNEISTNAIAVAADEFYSLAMYDDNLYVLAENPDGGNPRVHLVDLNTGSESTGSFPTTLSYSSTSDFEVVGSYLIVSHGGTNLTKIDPSSGGVARDEDGPTTGTMTDILPDTSASNALVAAGSAGVMRFLLSSNDTQFAAAGADLDDATALMVLNDELWVADADSDSLKSFEYDVSASTMGTETLSEISLGWNENVQEMSVLGGYLVVASDSGSLSIVGSGPWVEGGSVSPSSLTEDSEYSISFSSSQAGEFEVRLNADSDTGGSLISSGSIAANVNQSLTLLSSSSYKEGVNSLRIVVDSDDGTGHDTVYITVDTPPTTPTLTKANVGFGNESVTVSFDGIDDSDLSHYIVYISATEFTADEYSKGGPSFDSHSEEDRTISAEASDSVSLTLIGLENDQLYYVAVRAYDDSGLESEMSSIFSVTPQETFSLAELTGETGGFCGISTQAGILTLGVAMILVGFRRKEFLAGLALLIFPQMGEATTQMATATLGDEDKPKNMRQYSDLRYGSINFSSEALNTVFSDSSHQILYWDTGYSFRDVLGVSLGLGLVREKGYLVDSTGSSSSSDEDLLNVLPLNISLLARADFFNEQLLVPYASAGYDYWLWQEKWGDSDLGTDGSIAGGKQGWHYAVGGQFLLDPFDKVSASLMEVKRGIRDTYLSFEYRTQEFSGDGLNFSSESYSLGFCFTY